MIPTREIFWNIGDARNLLHLLMFIPLFVLVYGLLYHYHLWRFGKRRKKVRQVSKRMASLLQTVFTHRTILEDRYAGLMHLFIFWGFFILFLGTLVIFAQDSVIRPLLGLKFFQGRFYLLFKSTLDFSGILVLVGIAMGIYRRYVLKPSKLDTKPEDGFIFLIILLIILSGFSLEGLRLSVTKPPESLWSPVGFFFQSFFESVFSENSRLVFHRTLWWGHLGLAFFFLSYLPFSKLLHIFSSSLNIFVNSIDSPVYLRPLDFNAERFGVNQIRDFEWDSLLALDACTECGRCQIACPAHLSEKPLNPKKLILELRKRMRKEAKFLSHQKNLMDLIGNAISEEEIWACTTCLNCVRQCPVFIEPMRKIMDLRRHLILMKSRTLPEIERVFRNLEWFGDPVGMGKISRDELTKSIKIGQIRSNDCVDFLFWVGCQGYFHERNRKTINTLLRLFQKLNLKFTILGREETCCGDVARRMGNEYLFKKIAEENIELFSRRGITKIVTHCPHCFNVFKNEYPQFGGKLEIFHATELLRESFNKIHPNLKGDAIRVTFHDPCYLSRYNQIVSDPRSLLESIPGLEVVEMSRSKEETFCCGAGGGGMWLGRQIGKKINEIRVEEALGTKVGFLATACPYCLNMLEDGVKSLSKESALQVVDIIELLDKAII
jgi:Fe-S oxidoreductase/nitrate reductase gamma subunit